MTRITRANLRRVLAMLGLAAWVQLSFAAPPNLSGDTASAGEVWSTFQTWLHAYDVGDMAQIMDIFDRGVVFTFQGSADQSYDDLRRSYEVDLKTRAPGTTWIPAVEEIYVDGRLAFVRATWELHVSGTAAGDQVRARNRSLDVFRKAEGRWRIIRSINFPEKQ
jgi:uncharacterized protein (TIGR02246 family)